MGPIHVYAGLDLCAGQDRSFPSAERAAAGRDSEGVFQAHNRILVRSTPTLCGPCFAEHRGKPLLAPLECHTTFAQPGRPKLLRELMIGRRHVESASKSAPFTPCVSLPSSAARRIPTVIVDTFRPQMAERRFEELEPLLAELEELVKEE